MAAIKTLNEKLISRAVKLGGHKTKREAINAALEAYVKSKRRLGILDLFGEVDCDPAYDYKAARRRDNKRSPRN